jgi:MSHA biogenesis protein MshO
MDGHVLHASQRPRRCSPRPCSRRRPVGFTLIELVVTLVLISVTAATVAVFMQPAVNAYFSAQQRADLADQADSAVRRMIADVRSAVPNSIRIPGDQCFEVVPTVGGGRYRMGPDVTNDPASGCTSGSGGACSAWVDNTGATTLFDALNLVGTAPAANDWVVINNQNGNDVYEGGNRAQVSSVSTPTTTQGVLRINVASTQFPHGYAEGRFQVVSASDPSVFYVCSGADGSLNASGDGKGTLYRLSRSFDATYPTACPAITGAATVVTQVKSCTFVYDANHGATQQSGFIWLDLELTRRNESAHMAVGAHVSNVP